MRNYSETRPNEDIHIVVAIIMGVKLSIWAVIVWILALVFIFTLLAQMIHHEITGSVFTLDVSELQGFMGKWVFLGYLLDIIFVVLVARWFVKRRERLNE